MSVGEEIGFFGNELLDRKLMLTDWSFVKIARDVTITSGEMYPVRGISSRCSSTRSWVDERNLGNVEKGRSVI